MATASPLRVHAASESLSLALALLLEAAGEASTGWVAGGRFAAEVRELRARVDARRAGTTRPDDCELVDVERMAVETARLAHTLARECRPARISAVTAAILAESAARIGVEVISESSRGRRSSWFPAKPVS